MTIKFSYLSRRLVTGPGTSTILAFLLGQHDSIRDPRMTSTYLGMYV